MFTGCRAHAAVHGVIHTVNITGCTDALYSACEEHTTHDAADRFGSGSVISIPALQTRFRQKAEINTLVAQLTHIQTFVCHQLVSQRAVFHFVSL